MKWQFGSVKEKTRRFGEKASGRNERSSKKKKGIRRAVFLGKRRRRDFWEHSKEFCRRELGCASDLPLRLTDS
jgi:hypothetical protein